MINTKTLINIVLVLTFLMAYSSAWETNQDESGEDVNVPLARQLIVKKWLDQLVDKRYRTNFEGCVARGGKCTLSNYMGGDRFPSLGGAPINDPYRYLQYSTPLGGPYNTPHVDTSSDCCNGGGGSEGHNGVGYDKAKGTYGKCLPSSSKSATGICQA